MSKKIIYLLSLLMALSLVFASCKKNPAAPGGDIKDENNPIHNEDNAGSGGLYEDWSKIPAQDPITAEVPVLQFSGERGYRNPVGVVMGSKKDHVVIVSELRYAKTTADNDIAVDGATATDIHVTLSANSGTKDTFVDQGVIGTGGATSTKDNSHAAPVVFKVDDKTLVVVASGGVGISRVDTQYSDRSPKSKIEYCVVTLTEKSGSSEAKITSTKWQELRVKYSSENNKSIADAITYLSGNGKDWKDAVNKPFGQFGTHSARGFVDNNQLVLPVVVANQGTSTSTTEYMGNLILISPDVSSSVSSGIIGDWTVGSYTTFVKQNGTSVSQQKESRVVGKDGQNYVYIAVPNSQASKVLTLGRAAATGETKNNAPNEYSPFNAYDGSLGYLTLNWHGDKKYELNDNHTNNATHSLLMHVKESEYNPTIYLVQKDKIALADGAKATGWSVIEGGGAGKASSIDVLGDGTIITVAEQKAPTGKRRFDVVFSRYSQAYLNSKIAN